MSWQACRLYVHVMEAQLPFAIPAEAAGAYGHAVARTRRNFQRGAVVVAALTLGGVLLGVVLDRSMRWKSEVMTTGVQTQAFVVRVHKDNGAKNDSDSVRVKSFDGADRRFEFGFEPGRLDRYQLGATVDVWYERGRTDHIRTRWDSNEAWEETTAGIGLIFTLLVAMALTAYLLVLRTTGKVLRECERVVCVTRVGSRGAGKSRQGVVQAGELLASGRYVNWHNELVGAWLFAGKKRAVLSGATGKQHQYRLMDPFASGRKLIDPASITWDSYGTP
jgi:hypothetical protein